MNSVEAESRREAALEPYPDSRGIVVGIPSLVNPDGAELSVVLVVSPGMPEPSHDAICDDALDIAAKVREKHDEIFAFYGPGILAPINGAEDAYNLVMR